MEQDELNPQISEAAYNEVQEGADELTTQEYAAKLLEITQREAKERAAEAQDEEDEFFEGPSDRSQATEENEEPEKESQSTIDDDVKRAFKGISKKTQEVLSSLDEGTRNKLISREEKSQAKIVELQEQISKEKASIEDVDKILADYKGHILSKHNGDRAKFLKSIIKVADGLDKGGSFVGTVFKLARDIHGVEKDKLVALMAQDVKDPQGSARDRTLLKEIQELHEKIEELKGESHRREETQQAQSNAEHFQELFEQGKFPLFGQGDDDFDQEFRTQVNVYESQHPKASLKKIWEEGYTRAVRILNLTPSESRDHTRKRKSTRVMQKSSTIASSGKGSPSDASAHAAMNTKDYMRMLYRQKGLLE